MNATDHSSSDMDREDELDRIVDEILAQIRGGQVSDLKHWQARYPTWATELGELLPTLWLAEKLTPCRSTTETSLSENATLSPNEAVVSALISPIAVEYPSELGDYQLLEELGRGGMGIVFAARQKSLDRMVAIKVLARHLADNQRLVERFHREAHSAARLQHKNIVPVYDHGTTQGVSWYAMQRIEGEPLNESIERLRTENEKLGIHQGQGKVAHPQRNRPGINYGFGSSSLDTPSRGFSTQIVGQLCFPKRLAEIARDVAYALDYAHQHGVIHRDIKPANLILDRANTIWITDFGLARIDSQIDSQTDSQLQLTQVGDIVGTLRYAAPEQLDGVSAPSCDIYGLGVTLYELATLRPAWSSDAPGKILEQVRCETVTPPAQINPDIPRDLQTIILKAMARDPADRYNSARALGDDLDRFCRDLPIKARNPSIGEILWRWTRKNRLAASALLVVTLLIALVIPLMLTSYTLMLQAEVRRVNQAQAETAAANQSSQMQLIESRNLQARAVRRSGSITARDDALQAIAQGQSLLNSLPDAPATERLQQQLLTEAIAGLAMPQFHQETLLAWEHVLLDSPIVLDFNVNRIVVLGLVNGQYQLQVLTAHQPSPPIFQIAQHASFARLVDPYEGLVLVSDLQSPKQVSVWQLNEHQRLWHQSVLSNHWETEAWAVSPGNRFVMAIDPRGQLIRFNAEDRQIESGARLKIFDGPLKLLCNPTGEQIALLYSNRLEIRQFTTGQIVKRLTQPRDTIELSRGYWSPDESWFAVRYADGTVSIYELPAWTIARSMSGDASGGALLDASSDGRYLLATSWARRFTAWDVMTGESIANTSTPLLVHSINFSNLQIGPLVDSKQVSAFHYQSSSVFHSYALSSNPLVRPFEMALAPDGKLMVVGSGQAGLSFVDLENQRFQSSHLQYEFPVFDQQGHLWAIRDGTVFRWKYHPATAESGRARFDQRTTVLHTGSNHFSISPDGQSIAWTTPSGGVAVGKLSTSPIHTRILKPQGDIRRVIISPDEKWVVAPGWHEPVCLVFDIESGRVWDLAPGYTGTFAQFSPDGSQLVVAVRGESVRIYRSGQWDAPFKTIEAVVGFPSFSPDGSVLALGIEEDAVTLIDLMGVYAPQQLIQPQGMRASNLLFTPDGTQILFNSADSHCFYRWDLQQLCIELKKLNLESGLLKRFAKQDAEQILAAADRGLIGASPAPTSGVDWLEFEAAEIAILDLEARFEQASKNGNRTDLIEILQQLLRRLPEDPWYNNNLAWYLAESPTQDIHRLQRSLELSRKAVGYEPDNPYFINTLGVVHYRLGDYQSTIETLERSRFLHEFAADRVEDELFLSMAQARLRQRPRGWQSFIRGMTLHLRHTPRNGDRWTIAAEAVFTLMRN